MLFVIDMCAVFQQCYSRVTYVRAHPNQTYDKIAILTMEKICSRAKYVLLIRFVLHKFLNACAKHSLQQQRV